MQKFYEAANLNIERHLGDVVTEDHTEEMISEEMFVLALDGASAAGADSATANSIAREIVGGGE